jgi:hypothetical protein
MNLDWPRGCRGLCSPGSVDAEPKDGHNVGDILRCHGNATVSHLIEVAAARLQKLFVWPTDLLGLLPVGSPAYAVT